MSTAVVPRPAATVMVVRRGAHPLEVLMLRRSLNSQFVSGAYVFPGGAVDDEDGQPELLARCEGRDEASASGLLALGSGGLRYWVCALRECFEEAGVLLARGPGGRPVTFEDPAVEARFAEHRQALNAGERSFLEVCRAEGLTLPADGLHYVGHWITPEGPPRRYDTRFFVAMAPPGQSAFPDAVETIDHRWLSPGEALERFERGSIDLVFPTLWNLRLLARFDSAEELLEAVSAAVHSVRPVLIQDPQGRPRVVVAFDPEGPAGAWHR